jgi:hypothetical protein
MHRRVLAPSRGLLTRGWSSVILSCLALLDRGKSPRGCFIYASTRPCTLARVAHEGLVLSGCLGHTLDFPRRFLIFWCTSRGTKHHGHEEVINNGPSPLIRAQSLWVFWACYFPGEGPSIDTVPRPLPRGVQQKINGLHAILTSCRRRGALMRFNLISVLKSSLS